MDKVRSEHEEMIIAIIECGVKLLVHSQTSTVVQLKFGNA